MLQPAPLPASQIWKSWVCMTLTYLGVQSLTTCTARNSLLLAGLTICAAIVRVDEAFALLESSLSRRGAEVRL